MSTVSIEKPSEDGLGKSRVNGRFTGQEAGSLGVAGHRVCAEVKM